MKSHTEMGGTVELVHSYNTCWEKIIQVLYLLNDLYLIQQAAEWLFNLTASHIRRKFRS